MFLRPNVEKLDADLRYVKHMGLNTIRLEGRIDRDDYSTKTDELGILVMPGWTCCDAWENGKCGRTNPGDCGRLDEGSGAAAEDTSRRLRLALRQRQSSAGRDRADVSRNL